MPSQKGPQRDPSPLPPSEDTKRSKSLVVNQKEGPSHNGGSYLASAGSGKSPASHLCTGPSELAPAAATPG